MLAGPIIRRAEPSGIWIWLATSETVSQVRPGLVAFDQFGELSLKYAPYGYLPLADLTSDSFRCVRLGGKLYVTLFRIAPVKGSFPKDVILGYNFIITTQSGDDYYLRHGDGKSDLVDDLRHDLCYPPFRLPTLVLQSTDGNLAQGSCRRPGADGPDAFNDFDLFLKSVCKDPKRRPAALFLTGDQIYADWVAYPLFISILKLRSDIMGYDELLPNVYANPNVFPGEPKLINPTSYLTYHFSDTPKLRTRRKFVLKSGLTTDDGEGHLLTFGEFAAMYLIVWNPVLCANYDVESKYGMRDPAAINLKDFTKHAAEARRVLANIPTYMSFDDHEITDDWNLDNKWIEDLKSTPAAPIAPARHILSNGIAAFWFFQGWGNIPELQGKGSGAQTTDLIEKRLSNLILSPIKHATDESFEKAMLDLEREPYAFVAPTRPPVIVTDMRTHRLFGTEGSLMNKTAFEHLAKILKGVQTINKTIVLVSGSPLLNWNPVSHGRGLLAMFTSPEKGRTKYEIGDLWDDYREGRARFLQWIHDTLKPSLCVIFSGDVHHGFVIKGKVTPPPPVDPWSLDFVQITSSPMKNEPHDLHDDVIPGLPLAYLLERHFSTSGTYTWFSSGGGLDISFEALELKGELSERVNRFLLPGYSSVIIANHICVVDFSKQKQITANYYGSSRSCSANTNI